MSILFYCDFLESKKWINNFKDKFKNERFYTVSDKPNYHQIEYAIIWNLPNKILKKLTNLKIIFLLGSGVDRVLNSSNYKNTPILRLEDPLMGYRMSYYVHSQILQYQLNLKYYQMGQLNKIWCEEKNPIMNNELKIGILGVGYLGTYVGSYLSKLNYNVVGYKKTPKILSNSFPMLTGNKLKDFILGNDIIISILPSTKETLNFIDKKFLTIMKKKSLLINVGRGKTIDEKALINHLKKNKNFHVSLDVFKKEPLKKNSPLWRLPNVTITPHVACITPLKSALEQIYNRFVLYKKTGKIKSDVNIKRGY